MDRKNDLEADNVVLDYLAEGAANIVYHIRPGLCEDDLPPPLHGVLMRFRKSTPSGVPYNEMSDSFGTILAPLFPAHNLIHPTLFGICKRDTSIATLNEALLAREADGSRPKKRHGVYLATEEENGLLVTDMTPRNEKEKLIEFKPKWLLQSPSAPADAKRCRTCALRFMRGTVKSSSERAGADFCPLSLLRRERDHFRDLALHGIGFRNPENRGTWIEDDINHMFEEKVQPLLFQLRDLQQQYNRVGLADFEEEQKSPDELGTRIGMTIRDCSLFIRYNTGSSAAESDVRLADLDMKSMTGEKWAAIEREMIEDGWYTATDSDDKKRGNMAFCNILEP